METCAEYGVILVLPKFGAFMRFCLTLKLPRDAWQGCHLMNYLFTEFCLVNCSSERGEGSRLNNPDFGYFVHQGPQPLPTG